MTIEANTAALLNRMAQKAADRPLAKWQSIGDVDWEDLDHFIGNCKRNGDRDSFDTALRVLEALKKQVLERP